MEQAKSSDNAPIVRRIFIKVSDIMLLEGVSHDTAWRRMKDYQRACNRPQGPQISVSDYCQATGAQPEEVYAALPPVPLRQKEVKSS